MTTLIQQLSDHDCALASIAMALGFERWSDCWGPDDLERAIKENGVGDVSPWLERFGLYNRRQVRRVHIHEGYQDPIKALLWKRRALVSVHSLNNDDGRHMIYWDGERVWDPSTKRTYLHLSSAIISQVILFDDTVPVGPRIFTTKES